MGPFGRLQDPCFVRCYAGHFADCKFALLGLDSLFQGVFTRCSVPPIDRKVSSDEEIRLYGCG